MQIVQAPDPVLSAIAKPIKKIDRVLLELIEDMKHTLITTRDPEGVGLAAPQIGKSLQLFIIKPDRQEPFSVFINPKILTASPVKKPKTKKEEDQKLEGCLSLRDIWGIVNRSPKVTMQYLDQEGITHKETFSGFFATIVQHEFDHLQGTLFPKRVLEQSEQLYKSRKNDKGEEVFEPIEL